MTVCDYVCVFLTKKEPLLFRPLGLFDEVDHVLILTGCGTQIAPPHYYGGGCNLDRILEEYVPKFDNRRLKLSFQNIQGALV